MRVAMEILRVAKELISGEIDEGREKSWSIKERLPVKVKVAKWGRGYRIEVPPMSMTYETWEYIGSAHLWKDIDVSRSSYDYKDGEAQYTAKSREDVIKWFEKYRKYVRPSNKF